MFKPVVVGGQDVTSLRAHFDQDDKNVIVASNRQITYYGLDTYTKCAEAHITPSKLEHDETTVAIERLDAYLYLFTNYGKIFIWNLNDRDWHNELHLPLVNDTETLIACKVLSKRQYVYTVLDSSSKRVALYASMSRSERESPKHRDQIGDSIEGSTSVDIGSAVSENEINNLNKAQRDKLTKRRIVAFIHKNQINFQQMSIGEKLHQKVDSKKISNHEFVCVRANPARPLVAAGDTLGRIYVYSGGFSEDNQRSWGNRTKFHWHRLSVSDLCFSTTGQTLYSCGGEVGCVVVWDLSDNNFGQQFVVANLGMPIRHLNSSTQHPRVIMSTEDNELIFMDTDKFTAPFKTLTRRTYDMYLHNNYQMLRSNSPVDIDMVKKTSIGLLWHQKTDTIVTNSKTGSLQFYCPKQQTQIEILSCLKCSILSLEPDCKVCPSEITKAAFSVDGDWLAFYETREAEDLFPEVRLHLWQRSNTLSKWHWIETVDRVHSTVDITDLKFSPDGQFLVSVGNDGLFQVLHRVNLCIHSSGKQIYSKGFFDNVPQNLTSLAAFSQDSSVLAISLANESILIWMIVDPHKLVYECQLNRNDSVEIEALDENGSSQARSEVLGLHFGKHEPSRGIAPLCEVRSRYIRIWNILNAQSNSGEMMEYLISTEETSENQDEFTAAAFDLCYAEDQSPEHFAVSTKRSQVYLFELKLNQTSSALQPLIIINAALAQIKTLGPRYYTGMCFLREPILDIDNQCHQDARLLKLIGRLCLMTRQQELVSFTDKLTFDRHLATNNCNEIKTYEVSDLHNYLTKSASLYREEVGCVASPNKFDIQTITHKQRRIRKRFEVQRFLKDLFERVPSHNLPRIEILGPMILNKLTS